MANEGGGKIKSKRSHGSKPYDRKRQSLFGRMKDKVFEFLKPSWLTEMAGTSSVDEEDKSEDEVEQTYSSPSSSRNSQLVYHHIDTPRPSLSLPYKEPITRPPSNTGNQLVTASTEFTGVSNFRQVSESTNSIDKREINGDNYSECSESTSGCSSMLPHPDKREYQKEMLQEGLSHPGRLNWDKGKSVNKHTQQRRHSNFTIRDTSQSGRQYKGLWSVEEDPILSRPQPSAQDPTISFNVSAFGTSLLPENLSLFGDSVLTSPFYVGKTRYGGASNHRKDRLQATSPYYRTTPVRQQVKVKVANHSEDGEFGMTSNTARRILEVLEKMSTPLSDAKKIPTVNNRIPDTPLSFMPAFHEQGHSTSVNKINNLELKRGPPINSINIPNKAVISKNLQPFIPAKTVNHYSTPKSHQNILQQAMKGASKKSDSELSKNRGGGKIKTSRSKENQHYSTKAKSTEEEVYELKDLPQVTLPIKDLPQFNFEAPTISLADVTTGTTTFTAPVFSFSTPIVQDGPSSSMSGPSSNAPFTFSSPLPVLPEGSSGNTDASSFSNVNFEYAASSTCLKLKENPVLEKKGVVKQRQDSENESIGFKPAAELKMGSVSDVLNKDWSNKFKPPAESWSCPECWISNKADSNSCAACLATKPEPTSDGKNSNISNKNSISQTVDGWECIKCHTKNTSSTICNNCKCSRFNVSGNSSNFKVFDSSGAVSKESSNSKGFGDKFKLPTDCWECPSCFIRNKMKHSKCVACDYVKPGASTATIKQSGNSMSAGFGSQFAKPKDMWECDICMVRNKADAINCVACQSAKPGNLSGLEKEVKFNFKSAESATAVNTGFSFGNTTTTSASSGFTFGVGTNDQNISKTNTNSTSGFSFGSKTDSSVSEASGFSFGKDNSNLPSTTGFQFSSPSTSSSNTAFTFNKPLNAVATVIVNNSNDGVKSKESEKSVGGFPFSFNQSYRMYIHPNGDYNFAMADF